MNLDELDEFIGNVNSIADTVSFVKENIVNRRDSFLNNERQTRSGLIDPILKILGWDVSQVDLVGSEYRTKASGTADYALLDASEPLALIEAKRLGRSFDVDISEQLANYTGNEPTVRFGVFTNGDRWRMRQTGKSGVVFDISLSDETPLKSALELMHLARNVLIKNPSETPIIEHQTRPDLRPTGVVDDEGWFPLARLRAEDGLPKGIRLEGRPLELPPPYEDAEDSPTYGDWKGFLVSFVKWLVNERKLTMDDCPVFLHEGSRIQYIVNVEAWHQNTRFISPVKIDDLDSKGGFWIETNSQTKAKIRSLLYLLDKFGIDSSTVFVKCD